MHIEGDIIEVKHLGRFRRTGVRRVPMPGEHYWCELTIGVALCTEKRGAVKEILECINGQTPPRDRAATGGG